VRSTAEEPHLLRFEKWLVARARLHMALTSRNVQISSHCLTATPHLLTLLNMSLD